MLLLAVISLVLLIALIALRDRIATMFHERAGTATSESTTDK